MSMDEFITRFDLLLAQDAQEERDRQVAENKRDQTTRDAIGRLQPIIDRYTKFLESRHVKVDAEVDYNIAYLRFTLPYGKDCLRGFAIANGVIVPVAKGPTNDRPVHDLENRLDAAVSADDFAPFIEKLILDWHQEAKTHGRPEASKDEK